MENFVFEQQGRNMTFEGISQTLYGTRESDILIKSNSS